ncbi:peptidyl-trna hydrolase protein [Fusarium flagelliforme]|uniref:Peptidyl-trna hydrolase protein n=1 Tax=Fusarium flagelliforme TaxID=2675880 RepID=A0A395MYW9_9HYPO|nr:peptidyl-trna hydrolase protein [Fusarium flagelliforme]
MFRRSVFTRLVVGLERMQSQVTVAPPFTPRFNSNRYKAFDADFDQESLVEARTCVRKSKYYTSANDSLTFQAQDSRSRDANAQDNRRKLTEELVRIYKEAVPAETSSEKKKKHQEIGKRFHDTRIKQKKFTSAKKQSRRGE